MTDHAQMKEKLFALYDGELEGPAKVEAEGHLNECAQCRTLFEGWSKTAKMLFPEPEPLESEFFVRRVMERVNALDALRPVSRKHYLRWLVPALGLATLFLVLRQPVQEPLSVEMLLLSDVSGPASWVFSNAKPTADEILGFAMEDES